MQRFPTLIFLLFSLAPVFPKEPLSQPDYRDRLKVEYLRVPMRDGVELAAKIVRPDGEGRFPGVMMYYPYRFLRKAPPDDPGEPWPVQPTLYLAQRGYAVVQYEVRGTGNSSGWSQDIYSDDERRDGYDMVEWIAAQPWCNGNVGMMGISYGGVVHVARGGAGSSQPESDHRALRQRRHLHRVGLSRRRSSALHVRYLLAPDERH